MAGGGVFMMFFSAVLPTEVEIDGDDFSDTWNFMCQLNLIIFVYNRALHSRFRYI